MAPEKADGPPKGAPLPLVLLGLGRIVERELGARLDSLGLTMRSFGILGHLSGVDSLSYSDLARRADITVQSMHTAVKKMIADDLVRGTGSAGRSAHLSITDGGRERLHKARRVMGAYETELLAGGDGENARSALNALMATAWRVSAPGDSLPPSL
ncbi:MAG: MarR family winged helix-turn-helix transcriptional regulator [Rhodococcus sp. (in: high G+C Gram-positive bacteria)]